MRALKFGCERSQTCIELINLALKSVCGERSLPLPLHQHHAVVPCPFMAVPRREIRSDLEARVQHGPDQFGLVRKDLGTHVGRTPMVWYELRNAPRYVGFGLSAAAVARQLDSVRHLVKRIAEREIGGTIVRSGEKDVRV